MTDILEQLLSDGVIDEILGRLKSGKEADVYLVRHRDEVVAAKVYKNRDQRGFKNNAAYTEGRQIRNSRTRRAVEKGSRFGQREAESAWKSSEVDALYKLHGAGVAVPVPKMFYEGVLLMQLVTDADGEPAPRMIDAEILREDAASMYQTLRRAIVGMLCCDLIHGDLSAYNVLIGADGPVIIDFPQMMSAAHNNQSSIFFRRDFENIHRHLAAIDPALSRHLSDGEEIWRSYMRRELTPDFVPSGRFRPPPPPVERRPQAQFDRRPPSSNDRRPPPQDRRTPPAHAPVPVAPKQEPPRFDHRPKQAAPPPPQQPNRPGPRSVAMPEVMQRRPPRPEESADGSSAPRQHNRPPSQAQHNRPQGQPQHNRPPGPAQHDRPAGPPQHNRPQGQQQHNRPPGPPQHNRPPGQQQHNRPAGPQQHNRPAGQQHNRPPGPSQHNRPPGQEGQDRSARPPQNRAPAPSHDSPPRRHDAPGAFSPPAEGEARKGPRRRRRGRRPSLVPPSDRYRPAPRFSALASGLSDVVKPAAFPEHKLRFRNHRWARRVGLDTLTDDEHAAHFSTFSPLPDNLPEPLALRYHGHQFDHYNRDLGDGRGFLHAQMLDADDDRLLDLATKGSGTTPWSRGGDGRLTLKGGVREILATEMLEALGVSTSKSFSLYETGEELFRGDEPSPARSSVLVRLGHSHVRFGTFQRLLYLDDKPQMARLYDYVVENLVPAKSPEELLRIVAHKSAELCASWMIAGFVHGVLNSDNMNVTGESFDYGPYRFLPRYDPTFTAAYFDHGGLYAFGRQPIAVLRNLERFGDALTLLAPAALLSEALGSYETELGEAVRRRFLRRLGVDSVGADEDGVLLGNAFEFLSKTDIGYDQFFFDWYGGAASDKRAKGSPDKDAYQGGSFLAFRRALDLHPPTRPERLGEPYFARERPTTLLIDELEAIFAPIAERDDWTPLEQKIAEIRAMGAVLDDDQKD